MQAYRSCRPSRHRHPSVQPSAAPSSPQPLSVADRRRSPVIAAVVIIAAVVVVASSPPCVLWVTFGVKRLWGTFGVTRLWGNAGGVVSAGSCRRLHYVRGRRTRRSPATSSCVSLQHRVAAVVVAGPSFAVASSSVSPPLPSPLAAHGPLARRRRGSRRCVAVSSRRRRPSRRPSSVRASPPSARSPSPSSRPPVATRRLTVRRRHHAVVGRCRRRHRHRHRCLRRHRRHRPRRQHSRSRVALPLCGRPCGLRRHLRPRALSVMFAAIAGYHCLVVTVVRRPSPPLSSLILASILTRRRAQPPCRRHR